MALPSSVTLGSLIAVFVAGVALLVVTTSPQSLHVSRPTTSVHTPHHPAKTHHTHARPTQPTTPARSTPPPSRDVVPNVLVVVYNNAGIAGLAASKASVLEKAGWHVAAIDNWYGNIPQSTVYYPPGLRPAAAKLAKVLGIARLHPAVSPMQFDRLTVILTSA